jgi:UDPglucose--hexose-1-phosphate uridylyltransferase
MAKTDFTDIHAQAEVRKHYYLDQFVVIAPKRTHSLHHVEYAKNGSLKSPPLENEPSILEIKGKDEQWAVKVVGNLYPAFSPGNKSAFGIQEVVLDTNPVDIPFGQLPVEQILKVFEAYRRRILALYKLSDINYVAVFHNSGLEAGASVRQTHSQIIATGVAPPMLVGQSRVFNQLKKRYGTSPLSKAIAWEQEQLARLVFSNRYIAIICPFASQNPLEAWIVPKRPVKSLAQLKKPEAKALAAGLKALTLALESDQIPYNFMLQEPVKGHDNHFMIRIAPRPNVWAGFELGTGISINPVPPEEAARWYRAFIKTHRTL